MTPRAIRERDGKRLLARWLNTQSLPYYKLAERFVQVTPATSLDGLAAEHPWLRHERLVVKADHLLRNRRTTGMLLLDTTWDDACDWLGACLGREVEIGGVRDVLDHFLVEPFVPHEPVDEHFFSIHSTYNGDELRFSHRGAASDGRRWEHMQVMVVPPGYAPIRNELYMNLLSEAPPLRWDLLTDFMRALIMFYRAMRCTALDVDPLVVRGNQIIPLDLMLHLDESVIQRTSTHDLVFPSPFGGGRSIALGGSV
jgi:succinyl-CoA synthetase beta subunit